VKLPWYSGFSCRDIRDVIPGFIILILGISVMVLVIPYAFASVIKQLRSEDVLSYEELQELNKNTTTTEAAE
jgi:hypothetical protein